MMMRQMRSLAMFAVVAALMAYGLGGGVFAQDATPVTNSEVGDERLVVIDHSTTDTVIDLGEEGDSIGDLLAFGNAVYDEGNETEVGTNQGSCVRTVPGEAWECMFSIILDEGQLTVAGPLSDAGPSELAITGGTGAYAGASGEGVALISLHIVFAKTDGGCGQAPTGAYGLARAAGTLLLP